METLSEKISEMMKPSSETTLQDTDASSKDVLRDLKEMFYASKDIADFYDFRNDGDPIEEGEITFTVDCKYLKYACGVLKHVYTGSKLNPGLIKIAVFQTQLKFSGFTSSAFGSVFIPLTKQTEFPENTLPGISFIFDYNTLAKITNSFEKHTLTFVYTAEKKLLTMDCGNTHLELVTKDNNEFVQFLNKIKEITPVDCTINMEILQESLNYLSLFIKKDNIQENITILECRDSAIVGGNYAGIGMIQSDSLNKVPLKLKHDVVPTVLKILPYFYPTNIKLFETEGYYLLRDQNLYLGIEKTNISFPPLKHLLTSKIEDSYIIPRAVMLSALQKLSVVTEEKDALISFKISGKNPQSFLTLSLKDNNGRKSKDIISISRRDTTEIYDTHEYFVNIDSLFKTFSFFKSPEIQIQEIKDKAILVKDATTQYSCITILSIAKEV